MEFGIIFIALFALILFGVPIAGGLHAYACVLRLR